MDSKKNDRPGCGCFIVMLPLTLLAAVTLVALFNYGLQQTNIWGLLILAVWLPLAYIYIRAFGSEVGELFHSYTHPFQQLWRIIRDWLDRNDPNKPQMSISSWEKPPYNPPVGQPQQAVEYPPPAVTPDSGKSDPVPPPAPHSAETPAQKSSDKPTTVAPAQVGEVPPPRGGTADAQPALEMDVMALLKRYPDEIFVVVREGKVFDIEGARRQLQELEDELTRRRQEQPSEEDKAVLDLIRKYQLTPEMFLDLIQNYQILKNVRNIVSDFTGAHSSQGTLGEQVGQLEKGFSNALVIRGALKEALSGAKFDFQIPSDLQ